MNYIRYIDWRLPSPSSTPESATLKAAPFQTPKADCPSTHFLEAFSTPRPNGQETPAQTPLQNTSGFPERPSSSYSHKGPGPEDPSFHVNHHLKSIHLALPPVSPARRLSSSPDPSVTSNPSFGIYRSVSCHNPVGRMNPFQMQTPPPTRDASSRRKISSQGSLQSTPATNHHGSMSTPAQGYGMTHESPTFQTPFQFQHPQFSPDVFQFPQPGPSTAPAYPQTRLFWDPNMNTNPMDIDLSMPNNSLTAMSPQRVDGLANWHAHTGTLAETQMPVYMHPTAAFGQPSQMQTVWPSTQVPHSRPNPFSRPEPQAPSTTGVNPSLLTSFAPSLDTSTLQTRSMSFESDSRQPYEHQTKELLREREMARVAKQQHSQTSTATSSGPLLGSVRPGLQRSNTDSGFRRNKRQTMTEPRRVSQALEDERSTIPRSSSPLKRHNQQSQLSLSAIPEAGRPRPRTRLVIGEDGRARTETDPSDDLPKSSQSSRARYSTMWDDRDSESETDIDDTYVSSRPPSFALPAPDAERQAKHARVDSDTEPLPRPSSVASVRGLSFNNKPRSSSSNLARRKSLKDSRRHSSIINFPGSFESFVPELEYPETLDENVSEAQLALKRAMEDRLRRQGKLCETRLIHCCF